MNLVIGASGRLGNLVAMRLLESGQRVRAHSRDPDTKLPELRLLGAEAVKGDLRDPAWLDDAMSGVQHVLIASQGLFPPSRTNHAGTVDEPGNRRVINAAKQASVEHIVFISTPLASPDFPCRFVRAKHQTEEDLKRSGVGHTILLDGVDQRSRHMLLAHHLFEVSRTPFARQHFVRHRFASVRPVSPTARPQLPTTYHPTPTTQHLTTTTDHPTNQ